jgi:hypothetical protein
MSTAPSPIEITINPSAIKVPAGYGTYKGHLQVVNDSHVSVTVTPSLLRIATGHPCANNAAPNWLTLSGKNTFKLAAGHTRTLSYQVHAAPGVNGTAAILATADGPRTTAGVVGGAVGEKVTLGTGSNCAAPRAIAPSHAGSGLSGLWIAVIIVAALLVAGVIFTARKIRRSS